MGTDKRARQKELHRTRLDEARRTAETSARKRRIINIVLSVVGALVIVSGVAWLTRDKSTTTAAATSPSTTLAAGETTTSEAGGTTTTVVSTTACPATDGSSPRTTTFATPPPICIDPTKAYSAVIDTNLGSFTVSLDAKKAPTTVNNFVVLARYHFYDGLTFHRVVPNFVIQGGDPAGDGSGGPGYTIGEEPPADKTYQKYDLAMAKTGAPNSTGSQFFVVTGDPSALNQAGTYSLFGHVTAGTEVVDKIGTVEVDGQKPKQTITMSKVTITES